MCVYIHNNTQLQDIKYKKEISYSTIKHICYYTFVPHDVY